MNAAIGKIAIAAMLACLVGASAAQADEFDQFAVESVSASLSSTQAGEHADLTLDFNLTAHPNGLPYARARDVAITLPPGMLGNPQAIRTCTVAQLGDEPEESECPADAQVGITEVTVFEPIFGTFSEPIYNMESPGGDVVARFGFFALQYPTFVNVRINPKDFSLTATIEGAAAGAGLIGASTTIWGVPAASSHDDERPTPEEVKNSLQPPIRKVSPEVPFLSNPTDCELHREVEVTAWSYQLPDQPSSMSAPFPEIGGCGKLDFLPTFSVVPTNPAAAAPTGIDATLKIEQDESPQGRATSMLKAATVTLPEGFTINPAAGDGLEACSADQVGFDTNRASACPDGAKIGTAEVEVPALPRTLHGAIYQRTPEPGHLFRFWLVTDEQGAHLKLPAEIQLNPLTGQVTTRFDGIPALGGNPQAAFSEMRLHIFGGPKAPLATPNRCGVFQTHYSFTPWSGRPPTDGDAPMTIGSGCGKGGFSPQLTAGSLNSKGGAFTSLVFALTREDGEASPETIAMHLPQGLLAKVGGVPLCPDALAGSGACPVGSRIGSLAAAAGVGPAPLWVPQPGKPPTAIYLAGPYRGAPYSAVSVVPAQAGPFDLGTVVNRAAIYIDPETALATIKTDPLPQFLEGVPVNYRNIHIEVDRDGFALNPTSCAPKTISASLTAVTGATAEPSTGFQATGCDKLGYQPKLKLRFTGQTKRTGNPGVEAVLTQAPHQANTAAATVLLPKSQFIDNSHISNPCTRVQFAAESCPKGSILGTVKARSPLLDEPLRGKVYFRSNGGDRELPDIVADLRGPIRVTLVGFIDSVDGRVRTRFLSVPDAPVTRFEIKFFAGKRSLIENSEDLCRTSRRAKIRLVGQNGRRQASSPVIGANCGRK